MYWLLACIIVILVLLLWIHSHEVIEYEIALPDYSWIKLYETYNFKPDPSNGKRYWSTSVATPETKYIKQLIKINLKSFDIKIDPFTHHNTPNLTSKQRDYYNKLRRVEIWSIYPGDTVASSEATGVSTSAYLDPLVMREADIGGPVDMINSYKANPFKYQRIVRVSPGEHVIGQVTVPVKEIMIVCIL